MRDQPVEACKRFVVSVGVHQKSCPLIADIAAEGIRLPQRPIELERDLVELCVIMRQYGVEFPQHPVNITEMIVPVSKVEPRKMEIGLDLKGLPQSFQRPCRVGLGAHVDIAQRKQGFGVARFPDQHFLDIAARLLEFPRHDVYPGAPDVGRYELRIRCEGGVDVVQRLTELVHPVECLPSLELQNAFLLRTRGSPESLVTNSDLLFWTLKCTAVEAILIG